MQQCLAVLRAGQYLGLRVATHDRRLLAPRRWHVLLVIPIDVEGLLPPPNPPRLIVRLVVFRRFFVVVRRVFVVVLRRGLVLLFIILVVLGILVLRSVFLLFIRLLV